MKYSFEEKSFRKIRVRLDDLRVLNSRLALNDVDRIHKSNIYSKVRSFVNVYNGNISWYLAEIEKETRHRNWFVGFTIFLILVLPFVIFGFTDIIVDLDSNATNLEKYSSLGLAIITSIFGFHKVLNGWLSKRRLLSIYHQASADLKSKLYAFEDRWNGRSSDIYKAPGIVSDEFDNDIEKAILEGRVIADNERKKYFEFQENPDLDLGNIFTSSFTQASSLFTNFQSKRFTSKLEELEAERKSIADAKNLLKEISQLESHLMELEALELETNQALNGASGASKISLTNLLASIRTKKNTLLVDLASKKSKR